jgi:methylated-DNA-[protein]-cysteine S-methyltransferase
LKPTPIRVSFRRLYMKNSISYDSPIGRLYIAEENGALTDLSFRPVPNAVEAGTPLLTKAAGQLGEYFAGRRRAFDLPLDRRGTPFQKSVWAALQGIPYGETRSYKEIAAAVGKPTGFRAVGMANNRNPLAVVVPCHLVIGADGGLTGYGGGLDVKQRLLDLERRFK